MPFCRGAEITVCGDGVDELALVGLTFGRFFLRHFVLAPEMARVVRGRASNMPSRWLVYSCGSVMLQGSSASFSAASGSTLCSRHSSRMVLPVLKASLASA